MKKTFEKIISISNSLPPLKQKILIDLLESIGNEMTILMVKNESYKEQISGIKKNTYDSSLIKAIDILKLLGFSENGFIGLNSDFLNWIIENTNTNLNYNAKLMNFYLLNSMQEAFFICVAENQGEKPTYNQVKKTMLGFSETIDKYQKELKLSLPELINKIDAKN